MSNITRFDPLNDLFRGFFVRPMDLGAGQATVPICGKASPSPSKPSPD